MKKNIKTLVLFGMIVFGSLFSITFAQVISSRNSRYNNVPEYYYANYQFADEYDAINERFRKAKARYSTNEPFTNEEFAELYQHFRRVFPHFSNKFSTTFEKCEIIARNLSNGYSDDEMEALMGNTCYKSLSHVINQLNSSYTVMTTATFNPNGGMAPVTITFDARGSSDPSQETIPTENFYWYYRDEKGVDMPMGSGQVINYTFDEPGKFIVHLVVRSSNVDQGILDGEKNFTINISPKAADIVVYANTRRMIKNEKLKIGTTEAEKGVVFDGSLTVPRGGRKIEQHQWIITNGSETIYDSKWQNGTPSYINRELKGDGEFKVTLKTIDNEGNVVPATYSLYVSDPVTVIKQTPSEGTTSATYNFDGSASYSVTKKLDKFFWEVFDANGDEKTNGAKIYYKDGKTMSIKFSDKKQRPGTYMVKLTITDIAGIQNTETREIYVDSTPPTPQFIDVPTRIWTYPSEFTLDASNSSDIDVENGRDSLEYSRNFDTDAYDIISTENNNEKIAIRFNEVGKHKVTLTVTDQYGKSSSTSKILDIKSTLRPEIKAIPGVITWQEYMKFESKINRNSSEIYEYNWDFGDKHDKSGQFVTNTEHRYGGKGLYTVSLTVTDNFGNKNTVKERVFIGEIDHPIAAFKVKDSRGYYIQPIDVCKISTTGNSVSMEDAYPIDRYAQFTINPSTSLNTKGYTNGLDFTFSKEQISGTISKVTRELTESFNQLGCHYVDLLVNDSNLGKSDGVRIRFNVKNALPTLKNITLTFPQYADNTSMFVRDNNKESKALFDCTGTSNLTIKVTAIDAKDPDGTISRLRFYYYNTDDPDRILEYKDTWMNAPYTHFVIPRMGGEYKFGVMVYDNEGGMIDSKEYLANNPAIYFPPSCTDSDVPTVTLKESAQHIQVGDTVTYTIVSKIFTNNEDFATDRTFYFDFTGDGIRDLVTKKDTATYTFMEEYEDGVTPRAAVEYRRKLGIQDGAKIYVKNGIKPILLYNSIGNKVIFRDLSVGIIQQRQICLNTADCDAGNLSYKKTHTVTTDISELTGGTLTPIKKNDVFLYTYPEYGTYNVSIYMKSKYGIEATTGFNITTKDNSNNGRIAPGVNMITIPETTFEEKITEGESGEIKDYRAEIFLAENMNNTLLMYINNENEGTCYVDIDISTDADGDGNADNDTNILCNKIAKITYEPEYESAIGRVWFTIRDDAGNEKLTYKNFYVTFITQQGYILELDEQKSEIYHSITKLIDGIPDIGSENANLKSYLNILRKSLNNTNEVTALVMEIKSLINEGGLKMDSNQKEVLDAIVASLSNQDTIEVSVGMSEYERNKLEILELLPSGSSINKDVEGMFEEFENEDSQEDKAKLLDKMRDSIIKESKSIGYDESYVAGYFCNIYDYYNISGYTKKCGTDAQIINNFGGGGNTKPSTPGEGGFPLWLKIILIILVSGVLIMIGTIVFFSIKAKLSSNSEGDEG